VSERRGLREGQWVYRVRWKDGVPYLEGGVMEVRGQKRPQLMALFQTSGPSGYTPSYYATLKEALEAELVSCGRAYGGTPRHPEGRPWDLVRTVTRLWRLYRKLQKHHLVPEKG
jgi:hypothetical protein